MMHMYDFTSSNVIWNKDAYRARVNKSVLLLSDSTLELDKFIHFDSTKSNTGRFIEGFMNVMKYLWCNWAYLRVAEDNAPIT